MVSAGIVRSAVETPPVELRQHRQENQCSAFIHGVQEQGQIHLANVTWPIVRQAGCLGPIHAKADVTMPPAVASATLCSASAALDQLDS